jgi:hypothetical protein
LAAPVKPSVMCVWINCQWLRAIANLSGCIKRKGNMNSVPVNNKIATLVAVRAAVAPETVGIWAYGTIQGVAISVGGLRSGDSGIIRLNTRP